MEQTTLTFFSVSISCSAAIFRIPAAYFASSTELCNFKFSIVCFNDPINSSNLPTSSWVDDSILWRSAFLFFSWSLFSCKYEISFKSRYRVTERNHYGAGQIYATDSEHRKICVHYSSSMNRRNAVADPSILNEIAWSRTRTRKTGHCTNNTPKLE